MVNWLDRNIGDFVDYDKKYYQDVLDAADNLEKELSKFSKRLMRERE